MKRYHILFKRACAVFIDVFFIGLLYEFLRLFLPSRLTQSEIFYMLVIIIPYCFKDIVFSNASIGKKVMRLVVVDNQWNKPTLAISVKRVFLSATVGSCLLYKAFFVDKNYIAFFDYEMDVLRVKVIDKKLLKELQKKSKTETGVDSKMMTKLYSEYLVSTYTGDSFKS